MHPPTPLPFRANTTLALEGSYLLPVRDSENECEVALDSNREHPFPQ